MSEPDSDEHDVFAPPPAAGPPQYGEPQYGPPPGYPPYPQFGGYGYPPPARSRNNGMAIAAMVCGICGFLCLVPGIVGIILGFVSLSQIKRTQQKGRGMAITGIAVGSAWIVLFVLLTVLGHGSGHVQFGNPGPGDQGN
jgi:hypothetical protein